MSDENSSLTCWGRLPISAKLMLPLAALHLFSGVVLLAGTGMFGSSRYSSLFGGEVIFSGVFSSLVLLALSVLGCLNAFDTERRHRWSITHVVMSACVMFGCFVLMAYGASALAPRPSPPPRAGTHPPLASTGRAPTPLPAAM